MEALYILIGLAVMAIWTYLFVFMFKNWKRVKTPFEAVVLIAALVTFVFYVIGNTYGY